MCSDKQCEQLFSGHDLFKREFLASPAKILCGIDGLLRAHALALALLVDDLVEADLHRHRAEVSI